MHTFTRTVSRSLSSRLSVLALVLAVGCGSSSDTPAAPAVPPPTATAPTPTLPGASGNVLMDSDGSLADADAQVSGAHVDRYTVPAGVGDRVRVTVTSAAFDPVLQIQPPGAGVLVNDDAAGDRTRSELELVVARAGDLKIAVTTYAPGATGAYHVHVERIVGAPAPSAPVASATPRFHQLPSAFRSYVASATPSAPGAEPTALPIRVGDRLQATLGAGDSTLPSGELADYYAFDVEQPGTFTIQMQSTRLDSFLVVTTPTGERLQNDDSGGTRDASLELVATETGEYRVVATSYRAGETGPYELKVLDGTRDPSVASTPSPTAPTAPTAPSVPPPPAGGALEHGELRGGDEQLSSGEYFDEYGYDWPAGTAVHLEARSNQFDTYLILRSPSGAQDDNDDQAPGVLNAALDFVAREAGHYRVLVTSYAPGMSGQYELEVRGAGGAPSTPTTTAPSAPSAPSTGGGEQRGELRAGDSQLSSGEFMDAYTYRFTPGDPVSIRLTSSAFDTYVIVRSPSGRQDDNDDFHPPALDSGFDIPAAEAGEYRVIVTSYQPGETGAYVLTVGASSGSPSTPTTPTTPTTPGAPVTPTTGGTHVWVVSVGISDYPGSANDLPECANDARKIVEALHNQGLSTPEREFLLVDADATVSRIHQAIANVARQIQPNDTFVFFYSGHGGQATAHTTDPDELDGVDEYIFVYDGQFMDDDMATSIDAVHALTLFSLDSCFAGGFSKDVVHRPGVIGMFSSEEDVTSGVASQFQAGGYLSHFLRLGIQGGADSDPDDTVTTVGELTHYMWSQWGEHASDVHMSEGYQQLVIDRGAVHNTEQFWRLGR
jgi:hypothetical protein